MSHPWEDIAANIHKEAKEARQRRTINAPPPPPQQQQQQFVIPKVSPLQQPGGRRQAKASLEKSDNLLSMPRHGTGDLAGAGDLDKEAELHLLRKERDMLRMQLMDRSADSSYRQRYEDLYRSKHSLPAEPGVSASMVAGTWNGQQVKDDGHSELGLHNFR